MAGLNVFIVEDDTITQMYLEHMLELDGHEVVGVASSGEQALIDLEQSNPDLILLDIELEGQLNGIDVATQLKDSSQVPIVFITGNSDRIRMDKRMKVIDPAAVLIKPVMNGDLTKVIDKLY